MRQSSIRGFTTFLCTTSMNSRKSACRQRAWGPGGRLGAWLFWAVLMSWNMLKHVETCWNMLKHIETRCPAMSFSDSGLARMRLCVSSWVSPASPGSGNDMRDALDLSYQPIQWGYHQPSLQCTRYIGLSTVYFKPLSIILERYQTATRAWLITDNVCLLLTITHTANMIRHASGSSIYWIYCQTVSFSNALRSC